MFWFLKLCLCNVPGLGGSDFKDNHFRFTEKRSVSDLKSYLSHLFPSRGARRKSREALWQIRDLCHSKES